MPPWFIIAVIIFCFVIMSVGDAMENADILQAIVTAIATVIPIIGAVAWLDRRIEALRAEMRAEIAALRAEMRAEIEALRAEVKADIAKIEGRIAKIEDKMDRANEIHLKVIERLTRVEVKVDFIESQIADPSRSIEVESPQA